LVKKLETSDNLIFEPKPNERSPEAWASPSAKIKKSQYEKLQKIAAKHNMSVNELMKGYIDKLLEKEI
jgi:LysM repeat protein